MKKIVICGGGIVGCSTAFYLKQLCTDDIQITIVEESFKGVACGSSGKAGGFLAVDWSRDTDLDELSRVSFGLHKSLSQLFGPETIEYRACSAFSVSVGSQEKEFDSGLHWLSPKALHKAEKIASQSTAAQVHPKKLTEKLLKASEALLVLGKVVRISEEGVEVDRMGRVEHISADAIVLSMGPWLSKVSEWIGREIPIYGEKYHSIVYEDSIGLDSNCVFIEGVEGISPEFYPRPLGTIYLCGTPGNQTLPDSVDKVSPEHHAIRDLSALMDKFTDGKISQVIEEQACFLPLCKDNLPMIGRLDFMRNVFVAGGHGCWGILQAPATGKSLAELILFGFTATCDLKPFNPNRFN